MRPDLASRLQVAFAGIHPDTIGSLLAAHGPQRAVQQIQHRSRSEHARAAVLVPATQRMEQLEAEGWRAVFRGEPGYPDALAVRAEGPDCLFIAGNLPAQPGVAVVGTRRCSAYGRNLASAYGHAIARAGWTLVSGLARGIDGAAHRGTVSAGGLGIAVLGCGLDIAYPREHAGLRDELVALGGCVVSEYPPGTPPEPWRFPPRNRIIAGLAAGVVVVEAAVKGGALITAHSALDQGVPVFATPGDINRASSAGCNRLIRDGAHPVLDPADLIAELELVVGPAAAATTPRTDWAWHGITPDEMARARGMPVAEAAACLTRAELAGQIVRLGDRFFPAPGNGGVDGGR